MMRRLGKTESVVGVASAIHQQELLLQRGALANPFNILKATIWGDEVCTMKWSNKKHADGAASVFDLRTFAEANTLFLKCKFRIQSPMTRYDHLLFRDKHGSIFKLAIH